LQEDVVVNMLKTIPKKDLVNIFWKTLTESDVSPLTESEKEDLKHAKKEFKKGETQKWESIHKFVRCI
jgi:hypothetical protein